MTEPKKPYWADKYWTPENLCAACGHPRDSHLGEASRKGEPKQDDSGWCMLPAGTCIFSPCSCTGFVEPEVKPRTRLSKLITYCGQRARVACDAKCSKAWGRNSRPTRYLGGDPDEPGLTAAEQDRRRDDFVYLADAELGEAPADPGTYEGGCGKPTEPEDRLNRWCVRECERCVMTRPGQWREEPELLDFDNPRPNIPRTACD